MWRTGLAAPQHVGSSRTRARTLVSCIGRQITNHCATREVPNIIFLLPSTLQYAHHQKFVFYPSLCSRPPSPPCNHYSVLCIDMFVLIWFVHLFGGFLYQFFRFHIMSAIIRYLSFSVLFHLTQIELEGIMLSQMARFHPFCG